MEVFSAFPTPIGVTHYPNEISEEMISKVKELATKRDMENEISVNTDILKDIPELEELGHWLEHSLNEYFFSVYRPCDPVHAYITHSWATFTHKGEGHHMHTHPNSFISGVFYLYADDELSFSKSDGYNFFEIPTQDWNEFNCPSINVKTETGKLVLFPSKLLHHVPPISHDGERIAIAFNTFLKGTLGSSGNKTQLELN
jgi:uncharacterized protein (TIGR02466 family)